jgi:hypothetical protein
MAVVIRKAVGVAHFTHTLCWVDFAYQNADYGYGERIKNDWPVNPEAHASNLLLCLAFSKFSAAFAMPLLGFISRTFV